MSFKTRFLGLRVTGFIFLWMVVLLGVSSVALAQGTNPVYFGDIVHGTGSNLRLQSTFQLFNSQNSQSMSVTIRLFRDDGGTLGLQDVVSGSSISPDSPNFFTVTIPPRGLRLLRTAGSLSLAHGWAQLTPSLSGLNANAFFQQYDLLGNLTGQAGIPSALPATIFSILYERSADVGIGVALANPSPVLTATLTLQFFSPSGAPGVIQNWSLLPLQHLAQFWDQFPSFSPIGNGFGSVLVTSNAPLVGMAFRIDHGQEATLPLLGSNALAPTITSLSPNHGPAGSTVTIAGMNFSPVPQNNVVTFNGVPATVITGSSTSLVVTVPLSLTFGLATVTVSVDTNTSNAQNFTVEAATLAPHIDSLSPPGAVVGSPATNVTINGSNFAPSGASVQFGSFAPALQVLNSTQAIMTLTAAMLANQGTFAVVFNNPGGLFGPTPSNTVNFVVSTQVSILPPTLTSINPTSGFPGQSVTLVGTNFDPTPGNNRVTFNGLTASQITSASSTQLVVVVPSGASSGFVTVTVNSLTSNSLTFTVTAAPATRLVTVGVGPRGVAYDPVKNQAVVTNYFEGSITFVDVGAATAVKTIDSGGPNPFGVSILNRQGVVAINNIATNNLYHLSMVDLDQQILSQFINVIGLGIPTLTPLGVAFDPSTGNILSTDDVLRVLVLPSPGPDYRTPLSTISVGSPFGIAVYNGPGGIDWALITSQLQGSLLIYDLATAQQVAFLLVGSLPMGVAVDPILGVAVVANSGSSSNSASIIDLKTSPPSLVATLPSGSATLSAPAFVGIDIVHHRAVVTNAGDNTITLIDLSSKTIIETVPTLGVYPQGVAVNLSGTVAIVANYGSSNVSLIALP
jgi:YVTN family beta-propeller protein